MTRDDFLRVGSDDIVYRLREDERERAKAIKRWRANACAGSIVEDDHIVRDAAQEIARLRILLAEKC